MLASHKTPFARPPTMQVGKPSSINFLILTNAQKITFSGNLIVAGIVIIVFRRRDFINVGLVLNVKSALLGKGLEFRIQDLGVHGFQMRV